MTENRIMDEYKIAFGIAAIRAGRLIKKLDIAAELAGKDAIDRIRSANSFCATNETPVARK